MTAVCVVLLPMVSFVVERAASRSFYFSLIGFVEPFFLEVEELKSPSLAYPFALPLIMP